MREDCEDHILLVRYLFPRETSGEFGEEKKNGGGSFLLCPGGGVDRKEGLKDAVVREVFEETGLTVRAGKILMVEDFLTPYHRMQKTWFLCKYISGELLQQTVEAVEEGILEVGWFTRQDLNTETVFPSIIKTVCWQNFVSPGWETVYEGLRQISF